ncbi:MAG: DUF2752 domain-containing protein [Candidatus Azobacteroides sp.]|nr:DUF2752 domain-containing protein [Candidatus Azobacteroides sp.]
MACAFLMLAVPCFIMVVNKDDHNVQHLEEKQSLCPFKMLTGFPCPGCGITKSFVCIYEGNFEKSLHYHLFGMPVMATAAFLLVLFGVEIVTGKDYLHHFLYSKKTAYACAIALASYHLIRTIYFCSTHTLTQILHESIWR